MKKLAEIKDFLVKHKPELESKYKVIQLGVFGSYARNEQSENSDLDVLVDFKEPIGLKFVDLADFLEESLHIKVDLVSKHAIKSNRWKHIEKEVIYV